ncbi:DUF7115 domain-containing protein [Halodesulfurarchaeum sp.]|uniref:DUF7115 domain-containing protein n=1 Tax=Halodesulfurarchaeum sp. TaxID=1980530 RepID=UPI001BBFF3CA|nr:hypothetical protein [Halodesulfurarchaeum sp.]
MDVPTAVEEVLGDETITEVVSLKGEDALYLTPSRTIYYGAEGFLSDESVETYPHDAERIELTEKRRKATITFGYGTDGEGLLNIPESAIENALYPILTEVFRSTGVIETEETVEGTYRFGELTLVVTSRRLVKHVGTPVWDQEYVTVPFDDIQGITTEEGNVSSQLVVTTSGRTERIKTPNEGFRAVDETVREAVYAYYDVSDQASFEAVVTPDESDESETDVAETGGNGSNSPGDSKSTAEDDEVVFVSATGIDPSSLETELDALETAIDEQAALIESQQEALSKQRARLESLRDHIKE